jgi:hypothetical protein
MAINDVSLTAGMRSNLLSLQGTVDLLNRTQNRLSSGKKVNTAIDNPVSFFASQALTARASTIDSLKDGMGQAIQTIQAADKGIKAISAMIEQAKGIAQAAQSAPASSGLVTETVTMNGVANGDAITIEGTTLTAGPTAIVTSYDSFELDFSADTITGGDTVKVGGATFTATMGSNTVTVDSFDLDLSANSLAGGDTLTVGGLTYTATAGSTTTQYDSFTVDATTMVEGDSIVIGGVTYTATDGAPANATEFATGAGGLKAAVDAHQAGLYTLTVDGTDVVITAGAASLDVASVTSGDIDVAVATSEVDNDLAVGEFLITGDANADATNLRAAINARQGTGNGDVYTVGGANSTVTITAGSAPLAAGTVELGTADAGDIGITTNVTTTANALAAGEFSIAGDTASDKATALRDAVKSLLGNGAYGFSEDGEGVLTITAGTSALNATTVELGTASATDIAISSETSTSAGALGALEFARTGDNVIDAQALANKINGNEDIQTAGYTASAKDGVLTLSKATDIEAADVTVSNAETMTEAFVQPDSELSSLQAQYNEMLVQMTAVANDSGYKGKNLLNADNVIVQFEGNTLTVGGFDASATAGMGISAATWTSGGSIDAGLTELDAAMSNLRQKSSTLSGNLSIITVRNEFSTNMINTLTEGSDKLTLADANEEGANMLMLQTRQTLSTTALSLSAQAAQSVLRLFG